MLQWKRRLLVQGLEGWSGLISVRVVNLDSLCRSHIEVSVFCARWIPAHLKCTQCTILLYLIDICFLLCICLLQISQTQTCLRMVVGPGFVSRLPTLMRISASHLAGLHGWLAPKTVNQALYTFIYIQFSGFKFVMALPRGGIKRKKKVSHCPNPLFLYWLTEWYEEAASKDLKTRFTYGRVSWIVVNVGFYLKL